MKLKFSGEEGMGRYVDLHQHYNTFINLNLIKNKKEAPIDYITYLENLVTVPVHDNIAFKFKAKNNYREYICHLLNYLVSFVERTEPLLGLDRIFSQLELEFECKRNKKARLNDSESESKSNCKDKETVFAEAKLKKLICDILREKFKRTIERVKNREGMTARELEDDRECDDYEDDQDTSITKIHNPLKLPMGCDGKPIPYWLYKLHGLRQEFKCQICGDCTYRGRRAFERHFQESRHLLGMRCLGIPTTYSKSFYEITLIEDALKLWDKIRHDQQLALWQPDLYEECEDEEGNIYCKKTFDDLLKQGLL